MSKIRDKMSKSRLNLRKVVTIVACLAVTTMFQDCSKKEVNQPICTITAPANNAEFLETENIMVTVVTEAKSGSIAEIQLYVDNVEHSRAVSMKNFTILAGELSAGPHTIKAIAINDQGAKGEATVNIIVIPLSVGMSYQGGKIAYIDATGRHGLIAAPTDLSNDIEEWWNGTFMVTGATGTAIGTGKSNTDKIVEVQGDGNYAAKLCKDLSLGGYNDWFLPSKDELNELYKNRDAIGGFHNMEHYWSSSEYHEYSNLYVWVQSFVLGGDGTQEYNGKNTTFKTRAVRYF